jgi:hypothetical protein
MFYEVRYLSSGTPDDALDSGHLNAAHDVDEAVERVDAVPGAG